MTASGPPVSSPPCGRDQLPWIRAGLRAGIDGLARRLLGEPVRGGRSVRTLKFGTRSGSLHVEVGGGRRGVWFDHAEGVGGDALALIQHVNGGSFTDAVAFAASWLGIGIGRPTPEPDPARVEALEREREHKQAGAAAQEAQDAARRVNRARWLWSRREPLTDSPGAVYLASRGIAEPAGGWPGCVAFLPASSVAFTDKGQDGREVWRAVPCAGAVMVAATGADGVIHGVQRVYVDRDGRNIRDAAGRKIKLTNGVLSGNGAVVRLRARGG